VILPVLILKMHRDFADFLPQFSYSPTYMERVGQTKPFNILFNNIPAKHTVNVLLLLHIMTYFVV